MRLPRGWSFFFMAMFVTAVILGAGPSAHASVWDVTREWTPEAEDQYSEWVKINWNRDYFTKPGPLKGLVMDCADAVYSMRILYASSTGLPFVMQDPTNSHRTISQAIKRFDKVPQPQRLRKFLQFIYNLAMTKTLPNDTYPVSVSRSTIRSGALLKTDEQTHHSWTIKEISPAGIPFLLFASRPAASRLHVRNEFPSIEFTFPNGIKPETDAGFRAFRMPKDIGKPVYEVTGYSLDQYKIPAKIWRAKMQKMLSLVDERPEEKVERILVDLCRGAVEHIDDIGIAREPLAKLGPNECFSQETYDDLSTPSRDSRLKNSAVELEIAINEAKAAGSVLKPALQAKIDMLMRGEQSAGAGSKSYCALHIAPGFNLTLGQLYDRLLKGKFSSNPHDPLEVRWGSVPGPSAKAKSCPEY
jgi:hypothetical protein